MPVGGVLERGFAKSGVQGSVYGCFLSQLTNDEELPYRYRSIFLHFPEYIAEEAGDARANYRYRFKDSEGKIYRLANCIIPGTAKGREMVDKLLRDAVTKDHSERMNRLQSGEMIASTGDWCSSANSEGFYCPYFACWADENQQHCVDPDGGAWSPEINVIDEPCDDECGGGGFPDWPGDDEGPEDPDDPWDPNPGGGSGTPCEDCGPGDEPLPPDEEPCGELGDDGCEDEDLMKPCEGNPVKNPRIAPQTNSGINGGRFGYTRSGGEQFHSGIDIANDVGEPFYAMYGRQVVSVNPNEHIELGYFVTIQAQIAGTYYLITYSHLKQDGRPQNGSLINFGDIVGIQGLSGNLNRAIRRGFTSQPHTHLQVRQKLPNNDWNHETGFGEYINPEPIITTQFDNQGNVVFETDC